MKQNVSIDLW